MMKKTLAAAILAMFVLQTQALAASADVEREILSGKAQATIPHQDPAKRGTSSIRWSKDEGESTPMSQAEREREILGNAKQSREVPSEIKDTKKEKKKKEKKTTAADKKKDDGQMLTDNAATQEETPEMHSSSMAWDNPNVSKNKVEKDDAQVAVTAKDGQATEQPEKKKVEKKKKEKRPEMSLAEIERMRLGGKAQPPVFREK